MGAWANRYAWTGLVPGVRTTLSVARKVPQRKTKSLTSVLIAAACDELANQGGSVPWSVGSYGRCPSVVKSMIAAAVDVPNTSPSVVRYIASVMPPADWLA